MPQNLHRRVAMDSPGPRAIRWLALVALLLGSQIGCAPECIDRFDCRQFQAESQGRRYTCEASKCVPCTGNVCPGEAATGNAGGGSASGGGGP